MNSPCLSDCYSPSLKSPQYCQNRVFNFWVQAFGVASLVLSFTFVVIFFIYFIQYPSIIIIISRITTISILVFFLLIFVATGIFGFYIIGNSCKANFWEVFSYAVLLLWTFIALLTWLLYLLNNENLVKNFIITQLNQTLPFTMNYSEMLQNWEATQSHFECCGINKYTDWEDILKEDNPGIIVPDSCCELIKERTTITTTITKLETTTKGSNSSRRLLFQNESIEKHFRENVAKFANTFSVLVAKLLTSLDLEVDLDLTSDHVIELLKKQKESILNDTDSFETWREILLTTTSSTVTHHRTVSSENLLKLSKSIPSFSTIPEEMFNHTLKELPDLDSILQAIDDHGIEGLFSLTEIAVKKSIPILEGMSLHSFDLPDIFVEVPTILHFGESRRATESLLTSRWTGLRPLSRNDTQSTHPVAAEILRERTSTTPGYLSIYQGQQEYQLPYRTYYREDCMKAPTETNSYRVGCAEKIIEPLYDLFEIVHDVTLATLIVIVLVFLIRICFSFLSINRLGLGSYHDCIRKCQPCCRPNLQPQPNGDDDKIWGFPHNLVS